MNYNVDCSNIKNIMHIPRPAPICAPRGGHRYKPRPEPRRHHLTHAADMGHTSPQRRHQHKAPCIVPLPTGRSRHMNYNIVAKLEAGPNGIRALHHQSAQVDTQNKLHSHPTNYNMSHVHGPQPPETKATLPCINQRRMTGWLYFFY